MGNTTTQARKARATKEVSFLGLEIRGNPKAKAAQELIVAPEATVTGRNEVRVSGQGVLTLEKGTVSSMRWVDVFRGGTVQGTGRIAATIYNAGTIAPKNGTLNVKGAYHEQVGAELNVTLSEAAPGQLIVGGDAVLNGMLAVSVDKGFKPAAGTTIAVLTAKHIKGKFANADDRVEAGGIRFKIVYTDKAVKLTLQ